MDANNGNNGQSGGELQTQSAPVPATTAITLSRAAVEDHPLQSTSSNSSSSSTSSSTSLNSNQSSHSSGSYPSPPPPPLSSCSSLSSVERGRDGTTTSLTTTTQSFIESCSATTAALEHELAITSIEGLKPRFYHVCPPARGTVPSPSDTDDKIRCLIREMMQPNPRCSICSTTSAGSSSSSSSTCASNSTSNIVSAAVATVDVSEVSVTIVGSTTSALPPLSAASADCSVETSAASTAVVIDEQDNDNEDEDEQDDSDSFQQQQEMFPLKEDIKWPSHTSIILPEIYLEKQQEVSEPHKVPQPQPPTQKRASRASVHLDKVNDYSHRIARYLPFSKFAFIAFMLALIVALSHLLGYDIYEQKTMIRIGLIWAFFAIYIFCLPTFKRWYKIWEHLPDREIQTGHD